MNNETKEILKKIKSVSNFDDYVDFVGTEFKPLLDYITNLQEENERLNNIINELEKSLLEKIEAIKTIKDMLGEEAKTVNPHIEVLETEYKYFLDKLKELKGK